jgi:hypothetical protein
MIRTALPDELVRARLQLALHEPGGTAGRPWIVSSASLVEVEATSAPCLRCESRVNVEDHVVASTDDGLVRVVSTACPVCDLRRRLYFRISEPH